MSWLSDYLRRRRIDPIHQTRRHFARQIEKHGFDIGEFTYGRPAVLNINRNGRLTIGSYCSIADDVKIILCGDHRADWVSTYPHADTVDDPQFATKGDVAIGSDVWIGTRVVILSGVTIGHGAIIGAGSIVSRDVPPYAIAVGNPARVTRLRFSQQEISALLDAQWWTLPREIICQLVPKLQTRDPAPLIAACREYRGIVDARVA